MFVHGVSVCVSLSCCQRQGGGGGQRWAISSPTNLSLVVHCDARRSESGGQDVISNATNLTLFRCVGWVNLRGRESGGQEVIGSAANLAL